MIKYKKKENKKNKKILDKKINNDKI